MQRISTLGLATAFGVIGLGGFGTPQPAAATMLDPTLQSAAPSLAAPVRCRIIRERVENQFGPFPGPVEYRERRVCDEDPEGYVSTSEGECTVQRERIVRPNGTVVYRRVRRCDDE